MFFFDRINWIYWIFYFFFPFPAERGTPMHLCVSILAIDELDCFTARYAQVAKNTKFLTRIALWLNSFHLALTCNGIGDVYNIIRF